MIILLFIILIIIYIFYYNTQSSLVNQDDNVCFNDFGDVEDVEKFTQNLIGFVKGNNDDTHLRAIGTSTPYYKPGDDVSIRIEGDSSFQDAVKTAITNYAKPFINLNFIFTTDASAPFIIKSGNPPGGMMYTGWCDNIGGRTATMTLANQRQMNILHELGHALGLYHESENKQERVNQALQLAAQVHGQKVADDIRKKVEEAAPDPNQPIWPNNKKSNATPYDVYSIMGVGMQFKRTSEYSDGDKLWFKKTYGDPALGKSAKPGW